MWRYRVWSGKSKVFETAPFFVVVNSKKIGSKRPQIPINIFVRIASIYFVPWECKNISCQKASGFFPSDFEFSFSAKFRDLLTSDDVISVLICILSIAFYSVLQYKHFEVWFVVLWFTVLETTTIFLSPTPKLSSCLSSERRTLWRHFWSYCRVTKSLPSLFLLCHMV